MTVSSLFIIERFIIIERSWKYLVRTDDFYLLFQPIVNVETSKTKVAKVDEYEVLLRSYKTDTFPSTVNKAKWMRKFGLYRQQGYYWGKGSEKIEQLD